VKPSVLFIHLAALRYVTSLPPEHTTSGRRATEFAEGIEGIIDLVRPWGTRVVFIGPIPVHATSPMNVATLLRPNPRPSTMSRAAAEAESRDVMSALDELSDRGDLTIIDSEAALCDETECSQYRNGWIYRDGSHLSPKGARLLRPALDNALIRLLPSAGA
jgi:hypothetical protein